MKEGVMSEAPTTLEGQNKTTAVCWVLGLGTLFAWNSIVTMGDYYYNLFPKYHPARVFTLLYQPFAVGTLAVLSYNEAKVDTIRRRILVGYILFFLGTPILIVVDLATSGIGGIGYFICTCAVVGAFGVAAGNVEGAVMGELSFMRPEFIQSYFAGLAAAGALSSALRLITKAVFEKLNNGLRKGAMLFLATSTFIELLCVLLYALYFPRLPIVQYYRSKAASEGSKTVSTELAAADIQEKQTSDIKVEDDSNPPKRLSKRQLFVLNIDYALDLFLIYAMTYSIFPGFIFENTGQQRLASWYPLVLVAMFNVTDLISRYIPVVQFLQFESRKGLMIATLARFLFIPAFYFTAEYAEQGWMIMLTSFLGLTNGYLSVCVVTVAQRGYKGSEQNALGNILTLCLLSGIFVGGCLCWLWLIGGNQTF